jgi:hypothetical protein
MKRQSTRIIFGEIENFARASYYLFLLRNFSNFHDAIFEKKKFKKYKKCSYAGSKVLTENKRINALFRINADLIYKNVLFLKQARYRSK